MKKVTINDLTSQAVDLANATKGLVMFAEDHLSVDTISRDERDAVIGISAAIACLAKEHYQALDEMSSQEQGEDVARIDRKKVCSL